MTQKKPDRTTEPDEEKAADERPSAPPDSQRKERVLHTRVPAALDDALKQFAQSMRVPVSNIVRVLLEDAVAVAQRATNRVAVVAEHAAEAAEAAAVRASSRPGAPLDSLAGVYGYQPLTIAIDTRCGRCGCALAIGDAAYLGLRDGPGSRVFVCESCLPRPRAGKSGPSDP